ncbi:hypothetical protein H1C71_004170 [Ictidomys tridecemlineatus]|nr:hypothetical protein H1C71_004170 [Ictidomys tridecemlineatus]
MRKALLSSSFQRRENQDSEMDLLQEELEIKGQELNQPWSSSTPRRQHIQGICHYFVAELGNNRRTWKIDGVLVGLHPEQRVVPMVVPRCSWVPPLYCVCQRLLLLISWVLLLSSSSYSRRLSSGGPGGEWICSRWPVEREREPTGVLVPRPPLCCAIYSGFPFPASATSKQYGPQVQLAKEGVKQGGMGTLVSPLSQLQWAAEGCRAALRWIQRLSGLHGDASPDHSTWHERAAGHPQWSFSKRVLLWGWSSDVM